MYFLSIFSIFFGAVITWITIKIQTKADIRKNIIAKELVAYQNMQLLLQFIKSYQNSPSIRNNTYSIERFKKMEQENIANKIFFEKSMHTKLDKVYETIFQIDYSNFNIPYININIIKSIEDDIGNRIEQLQNTGFCNWIKSICIKSNICRK